jgi:hypothetical protein
MKAINSQNQDKLLKIKIVILGFLRTFTLLLCVAGTFQPQVWGAPPPCPCECSAIPNTEVVAFTPCGGECAEIEVIPPETYMDNYTTPDSSCVSGLRRYRQEVTIAGVKRKTKCSGTSTWQTRRTPPIHQLDADCDGCPPLSTIRGNN